MSYVDRLNRKMIRERLTQARRDLDLVRDSRGLEVSIPFDGRMICVGRTHLVKALEAQVSDLETHLATLGQGAALDVR